MSLCRGCLVLWLSLSFSAVEGQGLKNFLPVRSVTMQYAGSVGTASVGVLLCDRQERLGVGLQYGRTPRQAGGPLNSYTIRFFYDPWKVQLSEQLRWRPLQTGVFISYTSGLELTGQWPPYLERGYYWWWPNFRQHIYLRTAMDHEVRKGPFARIGIWFEVNTNDLYLYSWGANLRAITPYDILFFGAGVQLDLRRRAIGTTTRPGNKPVNNNN